MATGTIFLDVKYDNINTTKYTFKTPTSRNSFIRVVKGDYSKNNFENFIHEHVDSVPDYNLKKLTIKSKAIKPGMIRVDFHRMSKIVWSFYLNYKDVKHYEVYFNKESPNVPIVFGFVTSDNEKRYCSFKTIFEYNLDFFLLDYPDVFDDKILDQKLKSVYQSIDELTFQIDKNLQYGNVQVNSSTVFDYYKKYTHTTNVYFKNSKIQNEEKWKLESFNKFSYPSPLLEALHVYFYEPDYKNINPFLFQFEIQLGGGGRVNYDHYELYDVDKTDPDSNNWVKKYRKREKSDIQNTEELLKEIYTTIFGSNKAGAIAGGVTTTFILGGGSVAGGVLYYKYPQFFIELISKIAGK